MESQNVVYPVISSGIDWLTCTAKEKSDRNRLADIAFGRFSEINAASGLVEAAKIREYSGLRGEGCFFGERHQDSMLVLSGPESTPLALDAIPYASNVSRIDLQTTVFTEGEEVCLSRDEWNRLKATRDGAGPSYEMNLRVRHPDGETLYLNSPRGDSLGRLYDKGSESRCAAPGLVWRYEVQWRRKLARQVARVVDQAESLQACASSLVHAWYTRKGVEPRYQPILSDLAGQWIPPRAKPDVLVWFEKYLSVTLRNAIARHGLPAVVAALKLDQLVYIK